MDPVVAGCTHARQGGLVGLPRHTLEEEMDWRDVRVKTHYNKMFKGFKIPENISQEDQQELKKCLAVTPEERQFLMSFCLGKVSGWSAIITTAVPVIVWVFHYTLAFRVNSKLGLLSKPRYVRWGLQGRSRAICWHSSIFRYLL